MYFRRIIYYLGTTEWLQLSKLEGETQCHALFWNDTYHTVTKWRRIIFFYSNLTPGEHFIGNFEWNRRIIRIIGDWGPLGYLLWVIAWGAGLRKGHCRFYWSFNLEVEDDFEIWRLKKIAGWRTTKTMMIRLLTTRIYVFSEISRAHVQINAQKMRR